MNFTARSFQIGVRLKRRGEGLRGRREVLGRSDRGVETYQALKLRKDSV